jgi:hypothetical protein
MLIDRQRTDKAVDDSSSLHTARKPETPTMTPDRTATLLSRAISTPGALTHGDVVQLQRTVGNRATGRLLTQEAATESPADGKKVSTEGEASREEASGETEASAETAERPASELLLEAAKSPIEILGRVHTIEYRKVGGEMRIGISSTWADVEEIHVELRRRSELTNRLIALRRAITRQGGLRDSNKKEFNKVEEQIKTKQTERRKLRSTAKRDEKAAAKLEKVEDQIEALEKQLGKLGRAVDAAIAAEKSDVNAYIKAAVLINDTVVAEVLGERMPVIELPTDAVAADNGHVRYHEGTQADPIPVVWYKPAASYANINVNDHTGGAVNVVALQPFGVNPQVTDPQGNTHNFGVHVNNRAAVGTVWRNTPKHGKSRDNQQRFNQVFAAMGHNLATNNEDGDHVRDLGFGGNDVENNYWPLNSVVNRYAFTGWRSSYYLNFKKEHDAVNNRWSIMKAPLNSGSLINKYIRIKGTQAAAHPGENNSRTAGSDATYGNQNNIVVGGAAVIGEA